MHAFPTSTRTSVLLALVVAALAGCASDAGVTAPATRAPAFAKAPSGGAIAALVLSPTAVASGASAQGTVVIGSAAPAKGTTVTLASSDPTVATVPSNVTVPRGQTSATFAITTMPTGGATVTITASQGRSAQSATLNVAPPALTGLTLSPASLAVNATGQGTVTLSGLVVENTTVTLVTSRSGVVVPSTVTILAGLSRTTFEVLALQAGSFTITASLAAETRTAALTTY